MQKLRQLLCLALCVGLTGLAPAALLAQTPRQDFDKAVAKLKKNPDDQDLRKKVIDLSLDLKALPPVPDEVLVLKGKAAFVMKNATAAADYQGAVDAYKEATNLAPWLGDLYYNLGVVEEKAGLPEEASADFKLYLRAKPHAEDRAKVLERLGALDVQVDKHKQVEEKAVVKQQHAAENSVAMEAWNKQESAAVFFDVMGGVGLCLGAIFVGLGFGNESQTTYTTAGVRGGENYNQLYDSQYFTTSGLQSYKDGQGQVSTGWIVGGIGLGVLVIGLVMSPGPKPSDDALLNLEGGKLALAVPDLQFNPGGGMRGTLLHASF